MNLYYLCSLFIVLILFQGCVSASKYNEKIAQPLAVVDINKDIDEAYHQLQNNHPRLYQYISKEALDKKFDSLKNTINIPLTSRQFYEKLAPVVKNIGQGHITLSPPQRRKSREKRVALKDVKNEFFDLEFINFGDELYVKNGTGADSVLIKSKVLAIDTMEPVSLMKKYNKLVASDGYNKTLYNNFIGARFGSFYGREKGFQYRIQVTFDKNDSIFKKDYFWFKRKIDTITIDEFIESMLPKKITKEERLEEIKIRKALKEYKSKRGYIPSKKQYTRTLHFTDADSTTAYLKIKAFSNGNYKDFYAETFQLLDSLKTQNLVIDLRDNGGGRLSEAQDLYSYLSKDTFQFILPSEVTNRTPVLNFAMSNTNPLLFRALTILVSPVIVSHNLLKTKKEEDKMYYHFKYAKPMDPKEKAFSGIVYVLINGNSFSASSLFSSYVQATNRGVLVGTETGGAYNGTVAGFFKNHKLKESQVRIRMGLMQIETPFKQDKDGYGVMPDVKIKPIKEEWLQGIDTEMQWILNDIKSKKNNTDKETTK